MLWRFVWILVWVLVFKNLKKWACYISVQRDICSISVCQYLVGLVLCGCNKALLQFLHSMSLIFSVWLLLQLGLWIKVAPLNHGEKVKPFFLKKENFRQRKHTICMWVYLPYKLNYPCMLCSFSYPHPTTNFWCPFSQRFFFSVN